ncbi:NHL repeat-containing protein [Chloroflexota bacterium]
MIRNLGGKLGRLFIVILFGSIALSSPILIHAVGTSTATITIAGNYFPGFSGDGGQASNAYLDDPVGIVVDGNGHLYIADSFNHRIRKVISPTGIITTVAGSGDIGYGNGSFSGDNGPATMAQFDTPEDVAIDQMGNIYIADTFNNRIRKVISPTGIVITIAGDGNFCSSYLCGDNGPAINAQLTWPRGVSVDNDGNVYIVDTFSQRIRKVISSTGIITTVAGSGSTCSPSTDLCGDNGPAASARLNYPFSMAIDKFGNLYIVDKEGHRIRKVIASTGIITTVAGTGNVCSTPDASIACGDNGLAIDAELNNPNGVAVDMEGNLYIADSSNHRIRKVISATGVITTVEGTGIASGTALKYPRDVTLDTSDSLYISDSFNHRIRKIIVLSEQFYLPIITKNNL